MDSERAAFEFGPPPRDRGIPAWMREVPAIADVSLALLARLFEPGAVLSAQLLHRYRSALVTAARERAGRLSQRPRHPIHLTRNDLKELVWMVCEPSPGARTRLHA